MDSAESTQLPKRKPGRPKGSRTRPALMRQGQSVPRGPMASGEDYRHADPSAVVSRAFVLLDWASAAVRIEMQRSMERPSQEIVFDDKDMKRLEALCNAIVRAMDGMKKAAGLADELAARKTPEELLEIALKKIEGQDLSTINYAIKRLRAYRERLAPVAGFDKMQMGETAASAIASLES